MRSQPATKYKGVYKDRELTCTNKEEAYHQKITRKGIKGCTSIHNKRSLPHIKNPSRNTKELRKEDFGLVMEKVDRALA